jgi:integrase
VDKPAKPYPDYPLFAHASGVWAKKIDGKLRYYGPWADPEGALARYERRAQEPHPRIASSTDAAKALKAKPTKPDKDFPLWWHKSGQWARWVHGHLHYFGTEADAALAKWLKQKDDLLAGREPVEEGGSLTLGRLCNLFLAAKQTLVGSGEIQVRTWHDYHWTAKRMVEVLGAGRQVANLTPADFEKLRADFAKTHKAKTLHNDITRARVIFKYAADSDMIDRPVRYGQSFKKPSKAILRKVRQSKPPRMFTAEEIQKIIKKAGIQLRAMVHLGVNCGMGNNDCAKLEMRHLDLKNGWLNYGRPKTGIPRRCPLWSETVVAIQEALASRPRPNGEAHSVRVFVTKNGSSWDGKSTMNNPICRELAKVLKDLGIYRKGLGFYALRHTTKTIGKKSRDRDAVRAIMGHVDDAMEEAYDEEPIDDERLRGVTDYLHNWLFREQGSCPAADK